MKKIFILIFSLLYTLPVWAGLGTELRETLANLDLAQSADIQLASCPLPGMNFFASREIGLNSQAFSGQCKKLATTKIAYAQQRKQLKKLQRAYRYFPELCTLTLRSINIIENEDLSFNQIEKYKVKLESANTSLKTKALITVTLDGCAVMFENSQETSPGVFYYTHLSVTSKNQSIPNALVELKNGNILVGCTNERIMLIDPLSLTDLKDLSFRQLLLLIKLLKWVSDREIFMHPEWYEVFKTLPQYCQDDFQHQIKLIKIDSALGKRRKFNHSQEDQQQAPRNGYAEFDEDLT